ncbi:MAG TPA: M23 family metallopeptidase [Kofleriaceae bacterium]|nr:M23 family metallopeptidase [Kofleriaceae bacterium]
MRSVAVPVAIVLIAVLACGNPYIVNGYKSPMGFGGQRLHPHTGIDFKAELGDPILAAADGDVAESTYFEDAGNVIVIGHRRSPEGYAYFTAYLHLDKREVRIGESVRRGDQIGRAGSTGWGASEGYICISSSARSCASRAQRTATSRAWRTR